MRKTLCYGIRMLLVGAALIGLAACGSISQTTTVPTARAPTSSPSPIAISTSEPDATTAIASKYTDLPQSTTPEGYHMLGQPDAPAIMMHYSDFL